MSIRRRVKSHIKSHLGKGANHLRLAHLKYLEKYKLSLGKIKIFYIFLFVGILLVLGIGIYCCILSKPTLEKQISIQPSDTKSVMNLEKVIATKGKFNEDQKMIQIGEETMYGSDLNNILFTYYYSDYATSSALLQPLQDKLLTKAQEESIILQEASKEEFITLSQTSFNSPNKDMSSRYALIATASAKLTEKFVGKISGETVSVWFHNTSFPDPKMGVEQAKIVARAKIESIHADLKSGKITFLQAKDKIINDSSLKDTDPAYKANAYYAFKERDQTYPIVIDPEINRKIWQLKVGEISEILTANDFGKDRAPYEALFKVVKINAKSGGTFGSLDDWLNTQKSKYAIKLL